MYSLTVENYVKAIFRICQTEGNTRATTGRLASQLNVSPGTVTSMLKTLSENGLATYTPYEGVRLTDSGTKLALTLLRRQAIVELFFIRVLQMSCQDVQADAEQMAHVVSDSLVEQINAYLGYPQADCRGEAIPNPEAAVPAEAAPAVETARRLNQCWPETRFRVVRSTDESPEFLTSLRGRGLEPGTEGVVVANQAEPGEVTVQIEGRQSTWDYPTAEKIQVMTLPPIQPPHFPVRPGETRPEGVPAQPASESAPDQRPPG